MLVWRVHKNKWNDPSKPISIEDETCTVELPSGPQDFRSTMVKVFNEETSNNINNTAESAREKEVDSNTYKEAQDLLPRDNSLCI